MSLLDQALGNLLKMMLPERVRPKRHYISDRAYQAYVESWKRQSEEHQRWRLRNPPEDDYLEEQAEHEDYNR